MTGIPLRCPDEGTCHHSCIDPIGGCWRVKNAEPLSGVYRDDKWPQWLIDLNAEYERLKNEQELFFPSGPSITGEFTVVSGPDRFEVTEVVNYDEP